ncbi:MAG: DMT family transporter [Proteobacteria bacterium]|nr:DMT family transporter [Pseudomonadota bacterium]
MTRPGFLAAASQRVPTPARAGLYMIVAALLMASTNTIIRHLGQTMSPLEVAFFRHLFGLLIVLPFLIGRGLDGIRTPRHRAYALNGAVTAFVIVTWSYALALMPVDKATALNFTVPIFSILGAALFLGERVGPRRLAAVTVGILGSLIILRPGLQSFAAASVLPLAAAAGMAGNWLLLRFLAPTEPPVRVVFYSGLYTTPFVLVPTLLVWQAPGLEFLLWALFMSVIGSVALFIATRAYALAEASVLAPFDFFRLPFGALLGFLAFGELMDGPSWLGAGIILGACLYIAHREARVQRAPRAAQGRAD